MPCGDLVGCLCGVGAHGVGPVWFVWVCWLVEVWEVECPALVGAADADELVDVHAFSLVHAVGADIDRWARETGRAKG